MPQSAQIAVYPQNLPSSEPSDWLIPLEEARAWKKAGKAFFINHGKAIRLLVKEIDTLKQIAGGSFSEAWHIKPSGYMPVWQLRTQRNAV